MDDNYTSVSIKGKAVVDYVLAAHNGLENCISFKVLTPNQLVETTGYTVNDWGTLNYVNYLRSHL